MTVNFSLPKNWMTTLGGLLAAVSGYFLNSGDAISLKYHTLLVILAGFGTVLLGAAAKDATTHSTAAEVQQASGTSPGPVSPKV